MSTVVCPGMGLSTPAAVATSLPHAERAWRVSFRCCGSRAARTLTPALLQGSIRIARSVAAYCALPESFNVSVCIPNACSRCTCAEMLERACNRAIPKLAPHHLWQWLSTCICRSVLLAHSALLQQIDQTDEAASMYMHRKISRSGGNDNSTTETGIPIRMAIH